MYAIFIKFKIKALFGVIYLLGSIDMNDVDFDKVFCAIEVLCNILEFEDSETHRNL